MGFSSFRRSLLGLVAHVLSRWLSAVNARIDAAPVRQPPVESADDPFAAPPPPDHWVELVRQGAPQLLDPEANSGFGVIDYRADDALDVPQQVISPIVSPRTSKPRPARLVTTTHRAPTQVPTVNTSPRRPMRLGNVTTQPLDADAISEHPAQSEADSLELPPPRTTALEPVQPSIRRPADVSEEALPSRESAALPDEPPLSPHFPDLPFERRVREVRASIPSEPEVSSVRTSAGNARSINQRRTGVPTAPQQTVLRPTMVQPSLNVEQVTPDRWAPLPETAAEELPNGATEPPHIAAENRHRSRLKREQEGRTWSE